MPLTYYTGLYEQIYHHYEKYIYYFPVGGGFNDVVDVEEIIWYKQEYTLGWTGVVVVVVSVISGVMWLCLLGFTRDYVL